MSTSSVGSRGTTGGDRDSLLPSWDALKSNNTEGGKSGDGGEDDGGSVSTREVRTVFVGEQYDLDGRGRGAALFCSEVHYGTAVSINHDPDSTALL